MNHAGDMRYNSTTQMLEVYDGTTWSENISSNTGSAWKVYDNTYGDHRIPSEKQIALDELFGVM